MEHEGGSEHEVSPVIQIGPYQELRKARSRNRWLLGMGPSGVTGQGIGDPDVKTVETVLSGSVREAVQLPPEVAAEIAAAVALQRHAAQGIRAQVTDSPASQESTADTAPFDDAPVATVTHLVPRLPNPDA